MSDSGCLILVLIFVVLMMGDTILNVLREMKQHQHDQHMWQVCIEQHPPKMCARALDYDPSANAKDHD